MDSEVAFQERSDPKRFVALIEQHKRSLYKIAYVYCRDPEERRDLIQDMIAQLWRSFVTFEGRSSAATWVYRVGMNVAISRRRIGDPLPIEFAFDVADSAFDEGDGNGAVLRELIDRLDEMNRALILLHLDGFDHAEIAATLGTTPGNVATRLGRIRDILQRQVSDRERK